MIEGHDSWSLTEFKGNYNHGTDDTVPPKYFIDSLNIKAEGDDIWTREGSTLSTTIGSVYRFHIYKRTGEASRLLILNSAGRIYDSTNLNDFILEVEGMVDFSMVSLYNRAYITPHNRTSGLAGEKVYVYDGSGTARPAAGIAPTGFTLSATTSALSGNVEVGTHLFAVSYETASGFITAPGPATYTVYEAPGEFKVTISGIPLGPTGTSARHIVCTKVIDEYNGDQTNQQYFFVPGGSISDNTTTSIDLNFFDADLQESADYLFDQLSEIPAALQLINYSGRLVTIGENSYPSIARVSTLNEPESFAATDGFLTVDAGYGGGLKSGVEYRGMLYLTKSNRTYATQDNQNAASTWELVPVDLSIGTEVFGISGILDTAGNLIDNFLVADRTGLLIYDGSYRTNLTHYISDIWESINPAAFDTIQVAVDTARKRIYVNCPLDKATQPDYLLVGDYHDGMDLENIKWFTWQFAKAPKSISVDVHSTTKLTTLTYGAISGNIYTLSDSAKDDAGTAIDSWLKTALLGFNRNGAMNAYTGLRLRVKGSGNLDIVISSEDEQVNQNLTPILLSVAPGKELFRQIVNYTTERCSVKLRTHSFGEWFVLTRLHLFGRELWPERPQS